MIGRSAPALGHTAIASGHCMDAAHAPPSAKGWPHSLLQRRGRTCPALSGARARSGRPEALRAFSGGRGRTCPALALTLAIALALIVAVVPASAYLKFGFTVGTESRVLTWADGRAVRWFAGDRAVPGVPVADFDAALVRAFRVWEDVPSATIRFERGGIYGGPLSDGDGVTHLAFDERPGLDRTLAATSYTVDLVTAELLEADVFFNASFPWSVAPGGQPGRFDVESIAVHEVGHLLGLGHSAIGETELQPSGNRRLIAAGAVMFPIAFSPGNIDGRRLQPDDIAGVSDIYPSPDFRRRTGSVSGRVVRDGLGVSGAHIVAFHLRTGALTGGYTLDANGAYVIAGLEPGPIVLRVEPLDDGDVESFLNRPSVDLDFGVTFLDRVVFVPAGGNVGNLEIAVARR